MFVFAALSAAPLVGWPGVLAGAAWRDGGGVVWAVWLALVVSLTAPATALELGLHTLVQKPVDGGVRRFRRELARGTSLLAAGFLFSLAWGLASPLLGLSSTLSLSLGIAAWLLFVALAGRARVLRVAAGLSVLAVGSALGVELSGLALPNGVAHLPLLAEPRPNGWLTPAPWAGALILALGTTGVGLGVLPWLGRQAPEMVPRSHLGGLLTALPALILALGALGAGSAMIAGPLSPGPDIHATLVVAPWWTASRAPFLAAQLGAALGSALLLLAAAFRDPGGAPVAWSELARIGLVGAVLLLLASSSALVEPALPGRETLGGAMVHVGLAWTLGLGVCLVLLLQILELGWSKRGPSADEVAHALLPLHLRDWGTPWVGRWLRWFAPAVLLAGLVALGAGSVGQLPGHGLEGPELGIFDGVVQSLVPAGGFVFLVVFATTRTWLGGRP